MSYSATSACGAAQFDAFFDEAGEHGDLFGNGSSRWIVMGAVILPRAYPGLIDDFFREAHNLAERRNQFKKFSHRRLRDVDRHVLTKLFPDFPITTVQVGFYKPSLGANWMRKNFIREYNYLIKFTLERISWAVRDLCNASRLREATCTVTFSQGEMHSYEDVSAYLRRLRQGHGRYNCSAEWCFIDPKVHLLPHADETETHLADITASALHRALEPKQADITDDRFERNLARTLYRRNRSVYGLKLFPSNAVQQMRQNGQLEFLKLL
jgi:hypothetical protein